MIYNNTLICNENCSAPTTIWCSVNKWGLRLPNRYVCQVRTEDARLAIVIKKSTYCSSLKLRAEGLPMRMAQLALWLDCSHLYSRSCKSHFVFL